MQTQTEEDKERWRSRWLSGQTGWDQGQEHPALSILVTAAQREGGLPAGARFFSAGCGRAHNEAKLAELGYHVTAVDLSDEGLTEARKLYGHISQLNLRREDVFQVLDSEKGQYAAIFDRAMLCALNPDVRPAYLDAVRERLQPHGLFCAILFSSVHNTDGPPFAVDELTAWAIFHQNFELVMAQTIKGPSTFPKIREEWLCIWRRKESD